MFIANTDPDHAQHAGATHRAAPGSLPVRVCRVLVQAYMHRLERRIERAVLKLDRAGLLDHDAEPAALADRWVPPQKSLDSVAPIR